MRVCREEDMPRSSRLLRRSPHPLPRACLCHAIAAQETLNCMPSSIWMETPPNGEPARPPRSAARRGRALAAEAHLRRRHKHAGVGAAGRRVDGRHLLREAGRQREHLRAQASVRFRVTSVMAGASVASDATGLTYRVGISMAGGLSRSSCWGWQDPGHSSSLMPAQPPQDGQQRRASMRGAGARLAHLGVGRRAPGGVAAAKAQRAVQPGVHIRKALRGATASAPCCLMQPMVQKSQSDGASLLQHTHTARKGTNSVDNKAPPAGYPGAQSPALRQLATRRCRQENKDRVGGARRLMCVAARHLVPQQGAGLRAREGMQPLRAGRQRGLKGRAGRRRRGRTWCVTSQNMTPLQAPPRLADARHVSYAVWNCPGLRRGAHFASVARRAALCCALGAATPSSALGM